MITILLELIHFIVSIRMCLIINIRHSFSYLHLSYNMHISCADPLKLAYLIKTRFLIILYENALQKASYSSLWRIWDTAWSKVSSSWFLGSENSEVAALGLRSGGTVQCGSQNKTRPGSSRAGTQALNHDALNKRAFATTMKLWFPPRSAPL